MSELVEPIAERSADVQPNGERESLPPVLDVRSVSVRYNGEPAIEDITFSVQQADRVAIIGPNGAGKSTLILAIMGLLHPQSGSIRVARDRLGYVAQRDEVNWELPVTVRDVVMMGRVRRTGWLWPGRHERRVVEAALERVGMCHFADRQAGELSGGERRRVFIARALAQEADILLLDEPFSGVDAGAQAGLMQVLDQLHDDGITVLLSTHDLSLAFDRFDAVLALRRRLIAYGPARAVYTPETLARLYGGRLATMQDGQHVTVFVDDHGCEGC